MGVPLLLDIIDIADPGRGVGLGLGGAPSESVSSAPDDTGSINSGIGFRCCDDDVAATCEVEADEEEEDR